MKIGEARQAYSNQLSVLNMRRRALKDALKQQQETGVANNFDTVQISKELEQVDSQYKATQGVMESILMRESMIQNSESAKQQGEAMKKQADEMMKCFEIYRRIASGARVPPYDENRLLEFSSTLYMAAKNLALMAEENDKEYDSLWDDEGEETGDTKSASEIAESAEISVPSPESIAASPEVSFSAEA